jgi:hypothetical protein
MDCTLTAHLKHLPNIFANAIGDYGRYSIFAANTRGIEIGGFRALVIILWQLYMHVLARPEL